MVPAMDPGLVFFALADATRRALLDRLFARGGQTLGELCEGFSASRQGVTKHLALLERTALVVTLWRGREKLHHLNPVPIHEIGRRWIRKFERRRLRALEDLKSAAEEGAHAEAPVRLRDLHRGDARARVGR